MKKGVKVALGQDALRRWIQLHTMLMGKLEEGPAIDVAMADVRNKGADACIRKKRPDAIGSEARKLS